MQVFELRHAHHIACGERSPKVALRKRRWASLSSFHRTTHTHGSRVGESLWDCPPRPWPLFSQFDRTVANAKELRDAGVKTEAIAWTHGAGKFRPVVIISRGVVNNRIQNEQVLLILHTRCVLKKEICCCFLLKENYVDIKLINVKEFVLPIKLAH